MTADTRGPANRAVIQTSPDLTTWTTRDNMELQEYSEGQGEIVGDAVFILHWGDAISQAGASASASVSEPTGLAGLFMRILKENMAGTGAITVAGVTYDAVWWGKILSPGDTTTGTNGTTQYTGAGIAALFNERTCWVGRAIVKTSSVVVAIAFNLAPFNAWPSGDKSAATASVGGVSVYVHDATKTDTGIQWTASDIISYLMACNFRVEQPPTVTGSGQSGLSWAISDPQSCLNYVPGRFDANGKTLTQVLNALAGKRRGLTWWVTVSGTTLTVHIASGLETAITVTGNTVPANPNIWDQLDGGDPFLHPFTVRTVEDEVADEIVIKGSPRTIGITLAIYGTGDPFVSDAASGLVKGWDGTAETGCNTFLDTNNAPARRVTYERAWRRFELKTLNWDGAQYGSSGMPDALVAATSSSYGVVGWDGTTTRTGSVTLAGLWYEAQANFPCAVGFGALNVGARQAIVVVAEDFTVGDWHDHSTDWTTRVESYPPAVIIDDGHSGQHIRAILRAGRKILVSLALKDFFPFQVMWRRDPAAWPTNMPRTKTIEREDLSQEYLLSGLVTGVDADGGGNLTTTTTVTTRDNLVQLRDLLARARAYYEEPYQLAAFTDRGVWDSDPTYRPGTLLGNIDDGVNTKVINAMVTRRRVRLNYASGPGNVQVPYWSTSWETDIVYPAVDAFL